MKSTYEIAVFTYGINGVFVDPASVSDDELPMLVERKTTTLRLWMNQVHLCVVSTKTTNSSIKLYHIPNLLPLGELHTMVADTVDRYNLVKPITVRPHAPSLMTQAIHDVEIITDPRLLIALRRTARMGVIEYSDKADNTVETDDQEYWWGMAGICAEALHCATL